MSEAASQAAAPGGDLVIRPATEADVAAIDALISAAYSPYLERMDRPPAPMLRDHAEAVAAGGVYVIGDPVIGEPVIGTITLRAPSNGAAAVSLEVDDVAVHPDHQGRGVGRRLFAFADERAREAGARSLRLFTNAAMTENLEIHRRLGYTEVDRATTDGYDRVFLERLVGAKPHEMNQGFRWKPPAGPYRRITAEQAESYSRLGFFTLERAFDAETVASLVAEIDPFEAEFEEMLRERGGKMFIARADEITFTTHLVTRSDRLKAFASHPVLLDICADLLGEDVRFYWDQAVYKKPNTTATFPWHQDNGYAFLRPQQYLTCWIALTDATLENGCPLVVPGLHRHGTLEHHISRTGMVCLDDDAPDAIAAPVPAGSIVVFSSLTPHCTGPNLSDSVRKAYIVQYALDGAAVLQGADLESCTEVPADAPDRQFRVLVGGRPVSARGRSIRRDEAPRTRSS